MRIYLVRHGETDWNLQERMQGQADNALNSTGKEQAQIVADKLKTVAFDAAFSSTLSRAAVTAEIILGEQKGILRRDASVMEIGFGPWEGEKIARVLEDDHPLHNFFAGPDRYFPPNGAENFYQLYERSNRFMKEEIFPLENSCENVLIAGHGAWNQSIVNPLKNISMAEFWSQPLANCEVAVLDLTGAKLSLAEQIRVMQL